MLKHIPAIILACLLATTAIAQPTKETDTMQTPKNWKLLWTQQVDELKATARMFEHEKSGAPLLYLSCDDDNKVFCIAFRTPPTDSTGIAHIMEHSVLCGSKKYPSKEPFVDLLKGSLQTFLNAFTADDRTMYPVASRNDKDFTNLMNVYLDAVFFPNVVKIPEILMQEGWHYEVDKETGELEYNGIVYNEMKGVYSSPQSVLYRTIQKEMYPNSTYANDSGGNPDNIPDLTQAKFKAFHEKFYHPSNSMIFLYGDGNIEKHLEFLDTEYLNKFDKITVDAKTKPQPLFDKPKDITKEYSVDEGDATIDKTFLSANYLLPSEDDPVLHYGLDLLTYLLVGSEAAPLKRALLDAGIGMDISCHFDSSILQPCFSIVVNNTNPDKKEEFQKILDKTLKNLVANGIDKKLIEGAINRTEFTLREFQVSGYPKGLVLDMQILETWSYGGDPLSHLRFEPILKKIREEVPNGFFEKLIQKYLLDNTSHGFVMLQPKQGLEKEQSEALKKKLAEIKASLTPEQLDKIKKEQEILKERQAAPDKPEDVAKIPTLEISDIDRKAEVIPFDALQSNQTTVLNTTVETNGVVYLSMYFNAKQIPQADAPYVSLLSDVLGRLDTENHTYGDFSSEVDLHTGGISTGLSTFTNLDKPDESNFLSEFIVKTKVMLPKLDKGLELVTEMTSRTKFDDAARVKEIIQELRVGMEQGFMSGGHRYAQNRAASYFSPVNAYKERIGGIEYYRFLVDLEKKFNTDGKAVLEKLKKTAKTVFGAGADEFSITVSADKVDTVNKTLNETLEKYVSKVEPIRGGGALLDPFKPNQLNEAVVIPSRVQYVVKSADYRKAGFEYSGKMLVLTNILRTGYLWNNIRVQGGAYGGGFAVDRSGVFSLWSYRDPHLKRTVDIYEGVADYLDKLELSEEELTKAIIATIGALDKPLTPSEKGSVIAGRQLSGLTQEDVQRERDEVLSTTVEDLRKFAPMFREGMKQNNICVFGNEQKLDADKSLFKTTIRAIE